MKPGRQTPDARRQQDPLVLARTIDTRGAELRAKTVYGRPATYHVPRTKYHAGPKARP